MVCGEKCDGKLIIKDIMVAYDMITCEKCFNLWTSQDYNKLRKRVKKCSK